MDFPQITMLTEEEFNDLAPWYDLNNQSRADFEVLGLGQVATDDPQIGILQVFYGDWAGLDIVQIHGKWDAIFEIDSSTSFSRATRSDYGITQGVGICSSRSGVFISLLNEEDSSQARTFLESLVLDPS